MIKFFRKIRQNLLSEGKTGKYLKYAIGEILLVVIGILIAIQINEWNNNRIQKESDYQLIGALIADLKLKDQEILSDLKFAASVIEDTDNIIDFWAKNKRIDSASLKRTIQILGLDRASFDAKSPVLESLNSSDFWERLPDSLLRQTDDVYRRRLTAVKASYSKIIEYSTECKFRFLIPNGLSDTSLTLKEMQDIINRNDVAFISYVEVFRGGLFLLIQRFEGTSKDINELIETLNIYQSKMKK